MSSDLEANNEIVVKVNAPPEPAPQSLFNKYKLQLAATLDRFAVFFICVCLLVLLIGLVLALTYAVNDALLHF